MNATAVIGLLYTAGFDLNLVREHLKTFAGVKRRFTEKIVNDTVIIDDLPTIQQKSLQPWMRLVRNTQARKLLQSSNRILLQEPLPCWTNLLTL